ESGKTKQILRTRVIKTTPQAAPYLAGMEQGWTQSLERLTAYVTTQSKERPMSERPTKDSQLFEPVMTFLRDIKFAVRSLGRTKGLAFTVVLTLALGIGASAAIFSLVRGVLLRPLVNRDED